MALAGFGLMECCPFEHLPQYAPWQTACQQGERVDADRCRLPAVALPVMYNVMYEAD